MLAGKYLLESLGRFSPEPFRDITTQNRRRAQEDGYSLGLKHESNSEGRLLSRCDSDLHMHTWAIVKAVKQLPTSNVLIYRRYHYNLLTH